MRKGMACVEWPVVRSLTARGLVRRTRAANSIPAFVAGIFMPA
jgi:hypothetical protein